LHRLFDAFEMIVFILDKEDELHFSGCFDKLLVDLSEEEFDAFITFLNIDEQFIKTASEMELILFIKDKYDHFKSIK